MATYQFATPDGKIKTVEASSPQEAQSKIASLGAAPRSGVMLATGAGTGATPQSGTRNLQLSSGDSASSLMQTGAASGQVANTADPYSKFNEGLLQLLTRHQTLGTKRFAEQEFNAQGEQNNRVLAKTPKDLIGANPNIQDSVRSSSAVAMNPTINQARNAQQTFSEQIRSYGDAINAARQLGIDQQEREETLKANARETLIGTLEAFGAAGLEAVEKANPNIFKLAGFDKDTLIAAARTKETSDSVQEPIELSEGSTLYDPNTGEPIYTAPKTDDTAETDGTKELGVINDINNILADPSFEKTFGISNVIRRNNPMSPSYTLAKQVDTLLNKLALAARGELKGQGQISDFEGKMLRNAQTALKLNMNVDSARYQLKQASGAIRTSSGLTAQVKITAPDGTSRTGMANQATITQAIEDGNRVEYI